MLNDWTEIRNNKEQKARWKAAAALEEKRLSDWIRDSLDVMAQVSFSRNGKC